MRIPALLLLCAWLAGCPATPPGPDDDDAGDDDAGDDDAGDDDAGDDDAGDDDAGDDDAGDDDSAPLPGLDGGDALPGPPLWSDPSDLTVIDGAPPFDVCWTTMEPSCPDDYLALPSRLPQWGEPMTLDALDAWVAAVAAGTTTSEPRPADPLDFAQLLVDGTGIEGLLDGVGDRPLTVYELDELDFGTHTETEIFLDDPLVGAWRALVLEPPKAPRGLVLMLHGHGVSAGDMVDAYGGVQLVAAGFAVAAPDLRVNYADFDEDRVQRALLLEGFSLPAARLYEATRVAQYMLSERLDPTLPVGLQGHSGGSLNAQLAARILPGWSAVALDLQDVYADYNHDSGWILDGALPRVHPFAEGVNDRTTLPAPSLLQDYGFPDMPGLVAFFEARMP